jgi:hypothetical protein
MAELQKKSGKSRKPKSVKPNLLKAEPSKPESSNSQPSESSESQQDGTGRTASGKLRTTSPGRGASQLRSAVNFAVNEKSAEIARALVDQTLGGSAAGARLLIELSGAHHSAQVEDKREKRRGLSTAQLLASEPEWEPPAGADTTNKSKS